MKIKYEFADGTVSEVEVEESVGAVIVESRRKEDNLSRKERYHCYSLDSAQFAGMDFPQRERRQFSLFVIFNKLCCFLPKKEKKRSVKSNGKLESRACKKGPRTLEIQCGGPIFEL